MDQVPAVRRRRLDTLECAQFLLAAHSSKHLDPFLRGECSLSEAASALGISKSRMSYWLNKMLGWTLIEQVRVEQRGRHRVPIYRATADHFSAALDEMPFESDEQILEIHSKGFEASIHRAMLRMMRVYGLAWDVEYYLINEDGRRNLVPSNPPTLDLPMVASFGSIRLTEAVAQKARQDLRDLMVRYIQLEDPKGKRYLYQLVTIEESP